MSARAIFLDRDGVLNRAEVRDGKSYPPDSIDRVEIFHGLAERLQRLKAEGFRLIVVTNQPDVARGKTSKATVEAINGLVARQIPSLDRFMVCYHDNSDNCSCRKPKSGMLLAAASEFDIDLARSYMIGDRWSDIEAGRSAGAKTIFIDYGYAERTPSSFDHRVFSTVEALNIIESESSMKKIEDLNVKIFADGADKAGMLEMYAKPYIKGMTTNPSLMRKVGISDYKAFSLDILKAIPDRPISLEVFSDDFEDMERQALEIASWGKNVYVKIPVMNTKRQTSYRLIEKLAARKVKLNITALMTLTQVRDVVAALDPNVPSYVSVFAGRIADTGRDPLPLMAAAVELLKVAPASELIWASPRELLNIFHADSIGCQVITVTNDILKKLSLLGKNLDDYSLETVKMFADDAVAAGYKL